MASLIFSAFMMEAYLNHLGRRIFKCWGNLGWLSPSSKLNLIAEKLGVEKDEGKRPYRTFSELFKFRNSVAHGKSVLLKSDNQILLVDDTSDSFMREFLETRWEKYCTSESGKRALEDTETIIRELHNATGITDGFPFRFGLQVGSLTLLPEEQNP